MEAPVWPPPCHWKRDSWARRFYCVEIIGCGRCRQLHFPIDEQRPPCVFVSIQSTLTEYARGPQTPSSRACKRRKKHVAGLLFRRLHFHLERSFLNFTRLTLFTGRSGCLMLADGVLWKLFSHNLTACWLFRVFVCHKFVASSSNACFET